MNDSLLATEWNAEMALVRGELRECQWLLEGNCEKGGGVKVH